jgi:hypothetical protein
MLYSELWSGSLVISELTGPTIIRLETTRTAIISHEKARRILPVLNYRMPVDKGLF